jgi:hypothetical protein
MNKIKPFQQFIKESNGKSIGDRFEELVDESDDLGIDIKIDNRNREGDISEFIRRFYLLLMNFNIPI